MQVKTSNLDITFADTVEALRDVNLTVEDGEFVSIVGPSGCGKSTLLRILAGLQPGFDGDVSLGGVSPAESKRSEQEISFVFQEANLLPWRTVHNNVRLPLELRGENDSGDGIRKLLKLAGLDDFSEAYPRQLSGGMKMRASLARALVTQPDLLLMDEPFGALDEITRQRLNEELLSLWARDKWTCIFITHNVFEAAFLSQRVIVMRPRPGRIAAQIDISVPYPREPHLRADPEFTQLVGKISNALREAGE